MAGPGIDQPRPRSTGTNHDIHVLSEPLLGGRRGGVAEGGLAAAEGSARPGQARALGAKSEAAGYHWGASRHGTPLGNGTCQGQPWFRVTDGQGTGQGQGEAAHANGNNWT